MNGVIDIAAIYREEKTRWLRTEAPKKGFREYVANNVPYWIVIVAVVIFGLSAPHATVFNKLTPGRGWMADVGVELGHCIPRSIGDCRCRRISVFRISCLTKLC